MLAEPDLPFKAADSARRRRRGEPGPAGAGRKRQDSPRSYPTIGSGLMVRAIGSKAWATQVVTQSSDGELSSCTP